MDWLKERLSEPSTWRGLVLILTGGASTAVAPDLITQVIMGGLALSGTIGVASRGK